MSDSHLKKLIETATVDCYDEHEEFWGMYACFEDLDYPFKVTVLGDRVNVVGLSDRSTERRGLFVALEKRGQIFAFPISELDPTSLKNDTTANWIAAYQLWSD